MATPKGKLIPIGGNEARDYGEREDFIPQVIIDTHFLARGGSQGSQRRL